MLPLRLFRSRQFSGANGVTFVVYGALGGALFLLPVELQIVKGYSPLESGMALLPVTLVMLRSLGPLRRAVGPDRPPPPDDGRAAHRRAPVSPS